MNFSELIYPTFHCIMPAQSWLWGRMKSMLEVDKRAGIVHNKATLKNWLESFIERYWDENLQSELNRHIIGDENGNGGFVSRLKGLKFCHFSKVGLQSFDTKIFSCRATGWPPPCLHVTS